MAGPQVSLAPPSRPARVLVVYHSAGKPSNQRIFEAMAAHRGIRLRVLGPRRGYSETDAAVYEIPGRRRGVYELVPGRVYKALHHLAGPYVTGLAREIALFRPDVIHVFGEAYTAVLTQALMYRRLLHPRAVCYGMSSQIARFPAPAGRAACWRRAFVRKECAGIACWTESAKDALKQDGFPEGKLAVTHWGVPLDSFNPGRNEELKSQLGCSGCFVVGYVGSVEIETGLWTLLHAMRRLPPSFKCLCVGDGSWLGALMEKARAFGVAERVCAVGAVPHDRVPFYMHAMDALVVPSESCMGLTPAFSRVLPEAMACSVPVVAAKCGVLPEIMGEAGLSFQERDFTDLAGCLLRLSTDASLRASLGRAGRERSESLFASEAFAARLMTLYGIPPGNGGARRQGCDDE